MDLGEQKVYDLDMKKKTYTVTTFEQLRQKLREAQERAAKEAKDAPKEAGEPAQPSGNDKQYEFDFDVKETGQKRSIAGYDAKQVDHDRHRARKGQDARRERRRRADRRLVARAGHSRDAGSSPSSR